MPTRYLTHDQSKTWMALQSLNGSALSLMLSSPSCYFNSNGKLHLSLPASKACLLPFLQPLAYLFSKAWAHPCISVSLVHGLTPAQQLIIPGFLFFQITVCSGPALKERLSSNLKAPVSENSLTFPVHSTTSPYICWGPAWAWTVSSGHFAFTLARYLNQLGQCPFAPSRWASVWFQLTIPADGPVLMPQTKAHVISSHPV